MVNNQEEFNEKYFSKEVKEIVIRRNRNFQGQLVFEDYPGLENINLRDIRSIDKITLKNLPQLKECTIWDCGIKELVIENCPQLEKLNVRKNFLTSLEFLLNLRNLTELEIKGNLELTEILKPYNGDWKKWKGFLIHPKGSSYYTQSSTQKYEVKVESETSLKKESELETQIEIPLKGGS